LTSSSRIRKIAPDTDSAANNSEVMAMELDGANRPQLKKLIASHEITTISRGMEIELPDCSNNSQRTVLPATTTRVYIVFVQ
jgi:hypothetical protein